MRRILSFVISLSLFVACDAAAPEAMPSPDLAVAEPMCGLPLPAPVSCEGKADGELCDDSDACTAGDTCRSGVCRGESRGPFCVRCASDVDCCAGPGSVTCDDNGRAWLPTGTCTPDGACAMTRLGCLVGESCKPGKGCR